MPIMQTVIQGGGSSVDTKGWIPRSVDQNGNLIYSSQAPNFNGITSINTPSVLYYCNHKNTNLSGEVNFASVESITANSACSYAFYECPNISSVNMSTVTQISGTRSCDYMFSKSWMTSVDLSGLLSVTGSYSCENMFYKCPKLKRVNLSSLTTLSEYSCCQRWFSDCMELEYVNASSLTSLTATDVLLGAFGYTALTYFYFPSLTTITGATALKKAFESTPIKFLCFPSLNNLGTKTNQFNDMILNATDCTVVFPPALESTMSSWTDVINGFGGTNTTVIFADVKNIQVSIPQDYIVYFNGINITNESSVFAIIGNNKIEGVDPLGRLFKYTFVADANTTTFAPDITGLTFNEFLLDSNETDVSFSVVVNLYGKQLPITIDANNKVYATAGFSLTANGTKTGYYIEPLTFSSDTSATITLTAHLVLGSQTFDSSNILSALTGDTNYAGVDTTNNMFLYHPTSTSGGQWSVQLPLTLPTGTTNIIVSTGAYVSSEENYDYGFISLGTQRVTPSYTNIRNGVIADGVYLFRQSGELNTMTPVNYTCTDPTQNMLNLGWGQDSGIKGTNTMYVQPITVIYY